VKTILYLSATFVLSAVVAIATARLDGYLWYGWGRNGTFFWNSYDLLEIAAAFVACAMLAFIVGRKMHIRFSVPIIMFVAITAIVSSVASQLIGQPYIVCFLRGFITRVNIVGAAPEMNSWADQFFAKTNSTAGKVIEIPVKDLPPVFTQRIFPNSTQTFADATFYKSKPYSVSVLQNEGSLQWGLIILSEGAEPPIEDLNGGGWKYFHCRDRVYVGYCGK
jgi:hypothetical protein